MRSKIWKIARVDDNTKWQLVKKLNIPPVIAQILINRGITDVLSAKYFLQSKFEDLSDPFTIPGIEKAVTTIVNKITQKEKILIYGDYDVDGITSTVLMVDILRSLGAEVDYYIPDRIEEGYGLNQDAITDAYLNNYKLIITVDCGITAINEVNHAKNLGVEMIITDHHEPPEILPDAVEVINPKLWSQKEPWYNLAGVGVAFKLAHALLIHFKREEEIRKVLDLVVLGTVADIVSLKGENRIIVKLGLSELNSTNRIGLRTLIQVCGLDGKEVSTGHIGFMIAPRLNAAGRIGDPSWGVELLLTKDKTKAEELAKLLDQENINRQTIEAQIAEEAIALVEKTYDLNEDRVIVLAGENWHPGVIGIVASRVVEKFYRPTVVISLDGDMGKGSARSIAGFHLYDALEASSDYLTKYGGHTMAAGLSIAKEKISQFRKVINDYAKSVMKPEDLVPKVNIDCEVELNEINNDLIESLELLSPFGPDNPSPLLCCRNSNVIDCRGVGNGGNHLKLKVSQLSAVYDGIGFNLANLKEIAATTEGIDIAFVPEFNEWNGRTSVQLNVKDIKNRNQADNPFIVPTFIDRLFSEGEQWLENNWYKNITQKEEFFTKLVGVTFDERQEIIKNLNEGDTINLVREPNNSYDPYAIGVLCEDGKIGYLNKELAKNLAPALDSGVLYSGYITQVTGGLEKNFGVNIYLQQVNKNNNKNGESSIREELYSKDVDELKEVIRQTLLGKYTYRPKQLEAINALMNGYNTLAIFGTGRGKSAIFQTMAAFKALRDNQVTIIVYPLRALVNDQYELMKEKLSALGLNVAKANGTLQEQERADFFNKLNTGQIDIVLTTPEFLAYHLSKFKALGNRFGFFVVDESHHIAKAKRSTRPWYKELGNIRNQLNYPLTLAVTATADDQTAQEICDVLSIQKLIIDEHIRGNMEIKDVRNNSDKIAYMLSLVNSGDRVVIYVNSRKIALQLADELRKKSNSFADNIAYYHGGLNTEYRNTIEGMFRDGQLSTIVTTSAFGEGIDIPDIQHVVLYHLSFSMTELNQLAGRGGRNGQRALIHLLYGDKDQQLNDLILMASNPGREILGKIYLLLKEMSLKENPIQVSNKGIVEALEKLGIKNYNDNTVSQALGILEDLKLIERDFEEGKRKILILPSPKQKIDLNDSPRFAEGITEVEEFESFRTEALNCSASELLVKINRPMYPKYEIKLY